MISQPVTALADYYRGNRPTMQTMPTGRPAIGAPAPVGPVESAQAQLPGYQDSNPGTVSNMTANPSGWSNLPATNGGPAEDPSTMGGGVPALNGGPQGMPETMGAPPMQGGIAPVPEFARTASPGSSFVTTPNSPPTNYSRPMSSGAAALAQYYRN